MNEQQQYEAARRAESKLSQIAVPLGEVAGHMHRMVFGAAEASQEVALYGAPSECNYIIGVTFRNNVAKMLAQYGLTPDEYNALLIERCDGKQIFQLGLLADEF